MKKRLKKKWLYLLGSLTFLSIYFLWYQLSYIEIPNFNHQSISKAKIWSAENRVLLETTNKYSDKVEVNKVIRQMRPNKNKIRKNQELKLLISKGANPNTTLVLPDFSDFSENKAKKWLKKQQVDRILIASEFHDTIPKGKFIQLKLPDNITKNNYQRRYQGTLVFSKGKEIFQKNIELPDLKNKTQIEVKQWCDKQEIKLATKEAESASVEVGKVIQQDPPAKTKVAKHSELIITLSTGKAITVPDFNLYTFESAGSATDGLKVEVKQQYHDQIPFGKLISQSISPNEKLTSNNTRTINVIYSEGQPYLKDYTGQLEGELPKLFYTDYQTKGASINYRVEYVDASEKRGTIVDMSAYNQYVPLDALITIYVSNGAKYQRVNSSVSELSPENTQDILKNKVDKEPN